MLNLVGYQETDQIYSGSRTLVYRAIQATTEQSVIIKVLRNPHPNFNELVRFRNQYIITRNLEHPTIVQPLSLERYSNGYALVMPDEGALSLLEYWQKSGGDLSKFLTIALQLASALHYLGQQRIIHKDIKPANILMCPETHQVKLIDFSISSLLPKEQQQLVNPNVLEGTLAYISPEQTGRMNRGIDYRTDFYSLGVTLYELLTGVLPFQSNDLVELLHCHIAKEPLAPSELLDTHGNPYPEAISDIILKLMAKNTEERYQSALGLQHDLEQCWQQWEATGKITPFELGNNDRSDRFLIPEKLYGRETEVQILLDTFERVANGNTEMNMVAGFSGIGKTAVVNEVHKPIVKQRGYFIKGKFDQFNRNIPLSAFVQAFRDLMGQLLSESDADLAKWKAKILKALGDNAQVIIDVVPELERIIGKQSPAPELSGSAAQNRFNLLFQKFIALFTTKEHPLVIFLDDLQWADSASLNLMKVLMGDRDKGYLLLLGAYRDNEVFPVHPLMLTLDEITKQGANINTITLTPLEEADITRLVADTLLCSVDIAAPLSQLVYQKTQGNPFFTTQFLKGLYEDGCIQFDTEAGYWQCDLVEVRQLTLTDDVVEFMVGRLQKLPEATQAVLKLAACIGNQFDLETLAVVSECAKEKVATDLWRALPEGFVVPESDTYKFFQGDRYEAKGGEEITVGYRFLHDRVQQAAYSLIQPDCKQSTHLKIGQRLLSNTSAEKLQENIFEIVNQLNFGIESCSQQIDQEQFARLNLIAGRQAKATTAYQSAVEYLAVARNLLPTSSWENHYPLMLAIYQESAEAAYLSADFEQMEKFVAIVQNRAGTLLDTVPVYEVSMQAGMAQNKLSEAVQTGRDVLQLLGIVFPENPSPLDIEATMSATLSKLSGITPLNLINLPLMSDPTKLASMRILKSLAPCAYQAMPSLLPLVVMKQVELSIDYGNAALSPLGYAFFALILCGVVGDIETGYQFGELALNLLARLEAKEIQAATIFVFNADVKHYREPVKATLQPLQSAYALGLETGDLEFAALSTYIYLYHAYLTGRELSELNQEIDNYNQTLSDLKQKTALNFNQILQQAILNLMGFAQEPCKLRGEVYNEREMLPLHQQADDTTTIYYVYFNQMILSYLLGEFQQAVDHAAEAEKYLHGVTANLVVPLFYFYDSLARLACAEKWTNYKLENLLEKVQFNQAKMQKWAKYAPMNFQHKFDLITAEQHRVLNNKLEAIELYDRAIAGAKENEYLQEEALANELAAKFYLNWGKEKIATTYMQESYYCYACWGAKAKTDQLEEKYPQLLTSILQKQQFQFNPFDSLNIFSETLTVSIKKTTQNSTSTISEAFDFTSILQAAHTLSNTIELEQLLDDIVRIVLTNAGVQKAVLLIPQAGQWQLLASAQLSEDGIVETSRHSQLLSAESSVPIHLIQYIKNTQKLVLINEGKTEISGIIEGYLLKYQPQSVLCVPLLNQGQLVAIVYLEHPTTKGVFTPDRLTIIKFLCAQAAVSLQNAQLYNQAQQALEKLKQAQLQLVQSEKMSNAPKFKWLKTINKS